MSNRALFLILTAALLPLAGCSSAKEKLGFDRNAPDEFAVARRAPLDMPPDYSLRPPQPGAPRPQDAMETNALRQSVLGTSDKASASLSSGEDYLLQQTGGINANSDIRLMVDQETARLSPKEKTVSEKLLGFGKAPEPQASVVDPVKESERLKKNKAEGKPMTEGETPAEIQ